MATATTIIAMIITRVRVDRDGRSGDDTGGGNRNHTFGNWLRCGAYSQCCLFPNLRAKQTENMSGWVVNERFFENEPEPALGMS